AAVARRASGGPEGAPAPARVARPCEPQAHGAFSWGLAAALLPSGMDPERAAQVDVAADAGESFGRYAVVDEAALFPHLSSVHLACGFHAGDPACLRRSIARAVEAGLALGAHPGYRDLVGFGRRHMSLATDELFADVLYQLGALGALVAVAGGRLHH